MGSEDFPDNILPYSIKSTQTEQKRENAIEKVLARAGEYEEIRGSIQSPLKMQIIGGAYNENMDGCSLSRLFPRPLPRLISPNIIAAGN